MLGSLTNFSDGLAVGLCQVKRSWLNVQTMSLQDILLRVFVSH